jgi:hypothetical protein
MAATLAIAADAPPAVPPAPAVLLTPSSAVVTAAADLVTLPAGERCYYRYVSLYWLPAERLADYVKLVNFTFNSLNPDLLVPPVLVGDRLLRVDLRAYHISPQAFDKLISTGSGFAPFPEPYFYLTRATAHDAPPADDGRARDEQERPYHGAAGEPLYWTGDAIARDGYGRPYQVGTHYLYTRAEPLPRPRRQVELVTGLAPWLDKGALLSLAAETHTNFPIVRADWFLTNALLEPRYHELLGVGDSLRQFQDLVFLDQATADKLGSQARGAVLWSEVALHNRSLERTPTLARHGRGYFWASYDYNSSLQLQIINGKLVNEDVLSDLLNAAPDAQELIAANRIGLQIYFVANGKGQRLDKAAADVAIDARTPLRDKQVWTARNCIACHAQGIIPVRDEVRLHASQPIRLGLETIRQRDAHLAQRIADRYFAVEVDDLVTADQASYDAAVKACNGLGAAANALLLQRALVQYEAPVDLAAASADVGYPPDVVRAVIERGGAVDHTLAGLVQRPPRGPRGQRRDQWESSGLGQLQQLLAGVPHN